MIAKIGKFIFCIHKSDNNFFFLSFTVKLLFRSTTVNKILCDLMVINVEGEYENHVNIEETVDMFGNLKNRRCPMLLFN